MNMANMSYCRFQNTASDLRDCYDHMDDEIEDDSAESKARRRMIRIACDIADDYGHEVE